VDLNKFSGYFNGLEVARKFGAFLASAKRHERTSGTGIFRLPLLPGNLGMTMSHKTLRMSLGALAAVAAVTLGMPAQAGHVGANWDPTFHNGVASFFVPDPPSLCLTLGEGIHSVNPGFEGCDGVLVQSVDVNVNVPDIVTATLSLAPPIPNTSAIQAIVLGPTGANPLVVGLNSGFIPLTDNGSCDGECPTNWFLVFDSGLPTPDDPGPLDGLFNTVTIWEQFCTGDGCYAPKLLNGGVGATSTDVAFTPEPGSLGLLLGAVGAGWLARRRKIAA
jgi:hypothetical protein